MSSIQSEVQAWIDGLQATDFKGGLLECTVAEHEAVTVSARTTAALKAAKARGVVLGKSMSTDKAVKGHATQTEIADYNAQKVQTTINGLSASGISLRAIAQELNAMGVVTPRKAQWTAQAVKNAIERTSNL